MAGSSIRPLAPPLIAGGGPAGSAAAITLGRAGCEVLLLEREREPGEGVCGCFLSVEAVTLLGGLGVDLDTLGASHVSLLRVISGDRLAEAVLPFAARGLSRRALDAALMASATRHGAQVRRGSAVTSLSTSGNRIAVATRAGGSLSGGALFLATGKHELRGAERQVAAPPRNIALKRMLRLAPSQTGMLREAVELYVFAGGYCGMQLVENGIANLCMVVDAGRFASLGGQWDDLIAAIAGEAPLLAERLDGAVPLYGKPLAIARIPYGFVHVPDANAHPLIFRLGDQAAVIPSFSGDGIAIALHSGMLAAQVYLSGRGAADYHALLSRAIAGQFRTASLIDRLAASLFGRAVMMRAAASPMLMRWAARRTRMAGFG